MKPGKETQFAITGAITVATAAMGIFSSWSSVLLTKIVRNETTFKLNDVHEYLYWMSYSTPLGSALGCVLTLCVCDRYGRRHTLMLSAALSFCAMILATTLNYVWLLYVMNILWGMSSAMASIAVTIYLAEISDPSIRGRLYTITQTVSYVAVLFVAGIGPLVSHQKFNFWLLFIPLIHFGACFKIPESPYYLVKCNKIDQAKNVLLLLRKDTSVDLELANMQANVQMEMNKSRAFFGFLVLKNLKAIVIVYGLYIIQLMSGLFVVQTYYFDFLEESNVLLPVDEMSIIFLSVNCIGGIISSILVDIMGRRTLLLVCYVGCSVALAPVGLYYYLRDVVSVELLVLRIFGLVVFIGVVLFVLISSIGCYTLMHLYSGEMFALNVKVAAIVVLRFLDFIYIAISKMFNGIESRTGRAGLVWTFAGMALVGAAYTFFVVPETKGKSLEEIQEMLQGVGDNENSQEMEITSNRRNICNAS